MQIEQQKQKYSQGIGMWNNVRRRLGGLEESLSADLALDVHGLLVLDKNVGQ
jgi:hypothetical protein